MLNLTVPDEPIRYQTSQLSDMDMLARLERAAKPYRQAGYIVVSQSPVSITLNNPNTGFSMILFIILLCVFWPAAIIYSRSTRKQRIVCLHLTSSGAIAEEGATIPRKQSSTSAAPETVSGLGVFVGVTIVALLLIVGYAVQHQSQSAMSASQPGTQPAWSSTPSASFAPEQSSSVGSTNDSQPHSPPRGSAERSAILDALRKPLEKDAKQKIVFYEVQIKVMNGWAFVYAYTRDTEGKPLKQWGDFIDPGTGGLLRKKKKGWEVLDWGMATDSSPIEDAMRRFPRAPRSIFPSTFDSEDSGKEGKGTERPKP